MAALVLATMYRKLYPRYQRHKPERCTHGFSADSPPSHRHTCHTRVYGCHSRATFDIQVGSILECLHSVGVGTMHDSVPSLYKISQMRCDMQISREPSAKRCPNQRIPKGAGRRLCLPSKSRSIPYGCPLGTERSISRQLHGSSDHPKRKRTQSQQVSNRRLSSSWSRRDLYHDWGR